MQFDVTTGDYFGTLMSRLVDESRRLLKEDGKKFDPTPEAYKIQNDMCVAGDYLRLLDPPTMIIQNVPTPLVQEAMDKVIPPYREYAGKLIEHFIKFVKNRVETLKKLTNILTKTINGNRRKDVSNSICTTCSR